MKFSIPRCMSLGSVLLGIATSLTACQSEHSIVARLFQQSEPSRRRAKVQSASALNVANDNGFSFDLDQDGITESNIREITCTGDGTRRCLCVDSQLFEPREIPLHPEAAPEARTYSVPNTTRYRYYRLNVSANNGNTSYLVIREISLLGAGVDLTPAILSPSDQVATNSNWSAEQREFCAFDKDRQDPPDYKNEYVSGRPPKPPGEDPGPVWIYFDFGPENGQVVDQYVLRASNQYGADTAPRDWLFQATNGDPADETGWSTLDTRRNETGWRAGSTQTSYQTPIVLIGDHRGEGLQLVSLLYPRHRRCGAPAPPCRPGPGPKTYDSPALAVISVAGSLVLADAVAPAGLTNFSDGPTVSGFAFYPRGPGGLRHPALTPGFGDQPSIDGAQWGYGCLWKLGTSSDRCGSNMLELNTLTGYYAEVGGYNQEMEADGWEAMNRIYHSTIRSISSRTGRVIKDLTYDIAREGCDLSQPQAFHSGRNYGTHSAFTGTDGKLRVVMAGAAPVGTFDDVLCSVSNFIGVVEQPNQADPSTRHLHWARYFGFHWNSWPSPLPPPLPDGSAPQPSRVGDFVNNCLHTFDDSTTITTLNGVPIPAIIYNRFNVDYSPGGINGGLLPSGRRLSDRCKNEQYFGRDLEACNAEHFGAKGYWSMGMMRQADRGDGCGVGLTGSDDTYVYGASDALIPSREIVYLVEVMPHPVRFDLRQYENGPRIPSMRLRVDAIVDLLWSGRGQFPVEGRPFPSLRGSTGMDGRGTGSYNPFSGLTLRDGEGDLKDVLIAKDDGSRIWVGWSSDANGFVVKN